MSGWEWTRWQPWQWSDDAAAAAAGWEWGPGEAGGTGWEWGPGEAGGTGWTEAYGTKGATKGTEPKGGARKGQGVGKSRQGGTGKGGKGGTKHGKKGVRKGEWFAKGLRSFSLSGEQASREASEGRAVHYMTCELDLTVKTIATWYPDMIPNFEAQMPNYRIHARQRTTAERHRGDKMRLTVQNFDVDLSAEDFRREALHVMTAFADMEAEVAQVDRTDLHESLTMGTFDEPLGFVAPRWRINVVATKRRPLSQSAWVAAAEEPGLPRSKSRGGTPLASSGGTPPASSGAFSFVPHGPASSGGSPPSRGGTPLPVHLPQLPHYIRRDTGKIPRNVGEPRGEAPAWQPDRTLGQLATF